jgi:hypothetical protein
MHQLDKFPPIYSPIQGKTYTLFGKSDTSSHYYRKIEDLADIILERFGDLRFVLQTLQAYSSRKSFLERTAAKNENSTPISYILHLLNKFLPEYTEKVEEHLKSLPILKLWDRRLGTTRLQYHLYMLEIELTNRLFSTGFRDAGKKIALLPHCLKDFKVDCKASPDGFDYRCKHCSKNCYENHVSRLLDANNIKAYIWMGGNLKKKAHSLLKNKETLGILGIACIPELVWGMRNCRKYGIPAIGLPLDANRCARWMGSFHENSINMEILKKLIS